MAEPQQPQLLPDQQSELNGPPPPLPLPPPPPLPPLPLPPLMPDTSTAFLGSTKRQRRPSVRLGEIGEQPAASDAHVRRPGPKFLKPSSAHRDANSKFSSKTRALTNLVAEGFLDPLEAELKGGVGQNFESLGGFRSGSRDAKSKRVGGLIARRVRSNWFSKFDEGMECAGEMRSTAGEGVKVEGNYQEYDDMRREDSASPMREQNRSDRRMGRVRVSESREAGPSAADMVEMDVPSDSGGRDWINGRSWLVEDGGVRSWLNGLGLARYAPVFEIHEVDDEVLPLLTLEDLKNMGINPVGSRRKMYAAIQKLGKTFTS